MSAVGPLRLAAAVLLVLSDPALALAQSTRALRPVDAAAAVSHVGAVRHPLLGSTFPLWAGAGPPGGTVRRAAVRKRGSGSVSLR